MARTSSRGTKAKRGTGEVLAIIDGAARGNPGPAAYGVVFKDARGKVLGQLGQRLGNATNNVAEWRALLAALSYARSQGWRKLTVRTDSELLARQLTGAYRVRSPELKPLHEEAAQLVATLESFRVEAVPRAHTREADRLANAALDGRPVAGSPRPARRTTESGRGAQHPEAGRGVEVRAVYEAGILKPREPLDLPEGEEVELLIRPKVKN